MRPTRDWSVVRWARGHRFVVDAGVATVLAVVSILVHFHQRTLDDVVFREPAVWTVALVVVACAPIAWRRQLPIVAAFAVIGMQATLDLVRVNGPGWVPSLVALYSLGAYAAGRTRLRAVVVLGVAIVGLMAYALIESVAGFTLVAGVALFAVLAICFVVGDNMRRRRAELLDLAARADRAEFERELLAGQRVTEERTRIARELHDVVAHSVSVMVIQASAARRNLHRDPESAADLLGNIEETGRQTMHELRQILGVLRDGSDEQPPTVPMLCDLDSLVRSIPDLDVRLVRNGSVEEVPIGVALAAYRVVQEALTNAHRHGGPNVVVDVDVACSPDRVDVIVRDDGRGASTRAGASAGYGLIGMSERVAAFGGTLSTGPSRNGGWEVRAHFPLETDIRHELAS